MKPASKVAAINRIVITSLKVAIISWKEFYPEASGITFSDQRKTPLTKAPFANKFEVYAASKSGALLATEDFVKQNNPSFDVINLMLSFVIGENEQVTDIKDVMSGINGAVLGQVLGVKNPYLNPSATVFVNDIAKLNVLALNPELSGNQSFLANPRVIKGITWGGVTDIVAKNYPEAVAKGIPPNNGFQLTRSTLIDVSRIETVFGVKFQLCEVQVKSFADH